MTTWISVKDRLPDFDRNVLVYIDIIYGEIKVALYQYNKFYLDHGDIAEDITQYVTHWAELPDPPKEEKREYHPI